MTLQSPAVSALNELLQVRAGSQAPPWVAAGLSYLLHGIAFLAVLLAARSRPYQAFSSAPGMIRATPLYGSPDATPGDKPAAITRPAPPVATPRPTAAATPARTPQLTTPRPAAVTTPNDRGKRAVRSDDKKPPSTPAPAAGHAATDGAGQRDLLSTGGGVKGSPLGTLGGTADGGLQDLIFRNQWYVAQVRDIIYANWANPFLGGTQPPTALAVLVSFVIQRDGTITEASMIRPSGDSAFDRSGLRAVTSARLPKLPSDYPHQDVLVRYEFVLEPRQ